MTVSFELGRLGITPIADATIPLSEVEAALDRHARGDWGSICEEDCHQNAWGLKHQARVMSVYMSLTGATIWIITEADRSATTILLPEEY